MLDSIKYLIDYKLRFSSYFQRKLKEVQLIEDLEENKVAELRNEKFISLFETALRSSFYTDLFNKHGVNISSIQNIDDILKLPTIDKPLVRDNLEKIFIGNKFNKIKAHTSGTSGSPLTIYRDYNSIIEEGAYIWAHRARSNFRPGMRTVSLRGNLNRNQFEKYDSYSNTLFLSSYNLNDNNFQKYFERIQKFKPYAILAYPSSIELLAKLFDQKNLSFHVPFVFTSSETLYEFQRVTITKIFGSEIRDWYGNAERTIALQEDNNSQYDELPLYSINEYYNSATLTTSLINFSFPLIRYSVNDVIQVSGKKTSLVETTKIKSIQGRIDDTLILKDGTRIGRLDVAFKGVENLLFAQFIQDDINSFRLNLVVNEKFRDSDKEFIRKKVIERVGKDMEFKIFIVDQKDIILSKSGKYKLVICNVNPNSIETESLYVL
jgi:phenylacetate-CoA ligase